MTAIQDVPRRGITLGVWALAAALFPVVYAGVGLALGLLGQGQNGNAIAASIAYAMFFGGFALIPLTILGAVVLGILAVVRCRPLGKVLGGIALFLVIAAAVLIPVILVGSSDMVG